MCIYIKSTQLNIQLQGTNEGLIFLGILVIQQLRCVKLWIITLF